MTHFTKFAAAAALSALFVAPSAMAQTAMTPGGAGARAPMSGTAGGTTAGRSSATTRMAPRGGAMGGGAMPGGGNPANANGGNGPGGRY